MTFTIHRGASEIGGSCVEVCTSTTRIIIDIGMPLQNPDGSGFDQSKMSEMSKEDLLKEKILPNIQPLFTSNDEKKTALLISHAHQDHYGLISHVNKNIPIYLGEATHKLIELTAAFTGKETVIKNPLYIENYKSFTFGDIEITPYLMDHAAFDAYAFLVRGEGKSLFYTGDFRSHGRKSKLFYKLLHITPKNINWLLMEGTTLSRSKKRFETETQLEKQFLQTFKETDGINLVYLSGQNIDRLVTIFRSCKRSRKIFVIDFYIAAVLTELAALGHKVPYPSAGYSNIRVFFPNLLKRKMEKLNRKDLIERFIDYEITPEQINRNVKNIVMSVRSSMDHEIKRIENLSGGKLIYSLWEGYKNQPGTERFLSQLINRGVTIIPIHTSGHADFYTLQKLLDKIKPACLVPIHTTEGSNYKDIFPNFNIRQVRDGEIVG